ncbi:MAG TPA: hypothetical protein VL912_02940 [Candidatus Udaeobacter sp.]|jgi:hypothetical protein|nr:hypothetical protein [Candidatus Udaeobacter sp.]
MKAAHPANHSSFEARRREKVVEAWRSLGAPRVGEDELRQVQEVLAKEFVAADNPISPAAIARILADVGAEMLHPEIIEFDARWREARIKREAERFEDLERISSAKPMNREQAEALVNELEALRKRFAAEADAEALAELTTFAANARRAAQLLAKDPASDSIRRAEQVEISQWIKVWIQTPNLFADWLALRKSSPEFRKRFGAGQ